MEKLGRARRALAVKGSEMGAAVARVQAVGHAADDGAVRIGLDRAVSAEHPDDARVAVAPS